MFRSNLSAARPIEYYLLMEPQPSGRLVGYFAGKPIAECVIDAHGERYIYAGIAPRLRSGRYDVEALRRDEWLVEPGLVYLLDRSAEKPRFRAA